MSVASVPLSSVPGARGGARNRPGSAAGGWRAGDAVGRRRFVDLGARCLEAGGSLPEVCVAYETWGELSPTADNAVLVLHALTGDSHVVGGVEPGHATPGWWDGLVGPGRALDTNRYFVVAPNVLGGCQGTTGPSSTAPDGRPWGSRFPFLTIRDQVALEAELADRLGISSWALVVGGSMGGMRALEWGVMYPERVDRLLVLASTAYATADQIAWCTPQLAAIRTDPEFHGGDYYDVGSGTGPEGGLGVARQIAHATYRSGLELDMRFGRRPQAGERPIGGGGRYAIESYLEHHAGKLVGRFDANSYVVLTEAMNPHDVGRDRGGVARALRRVRAQTVVVSVDSDRLYPTRLSQEVAAGIRGCEGVEVLSSPYGHDGFLVEVDAVGQLACDLLGRAATAVSPKAGRTVPPSKDLRRG